MASFASFSQILLGFLTLCFIWPGILSSLGAWLGLYVVEVVLIAGLLIFPSLFLASLIQKRRQLHITRLPAFLRQGVLAGGYTRQLVSYYQTIAILPNLVGALASIFSNSYGSLGISEDVALRFLFTHLALLVISGVGVGLLAMSLDRALPAFLGELILSWAVISGCLLFLLQLVIVYQKILPSVILIMAELVVIYLVAFIYYVLDSRVTVYVMGLTKWPPQQQPASP